MTNLIYIEAALLTLSIVSFFYFLFLSFGPCSGNLARAYVCMYEITRILTPTARDRATNNKNAHHRRRIKGMPRIARARSAHSWRWHIRNANLLRETKEESRLGHERYHHISPWVLDFASQFFLRSVFCHAHAESNRIRECAQLKNIFISREVFLFIYFVSSTMREEQINCFVNKIGMPATAVAVTVAFYFGHFLLFIFMCTLWQWDSYKRKY